MSQLLKVLHGQAFGWQVPSVHLRQLNPHALPAPEDMGARNRCLRKESKEEPSLIAGLVAVRGFGHVSKKTLKPEIVVKLGLRTRLLTKLPCFPEKRSLSHQGECI